MVAPPALENDLMRAASLLAICLLLPLITRAELEVVIVQGLGGEARYTEQFDEQRDALVAAARSLTDADRIRVFAADSARRQDILDHFETLAKKLDGNDRLALFLVGHGSFDDHQYKFNIGGEDLTDEDLLAMLNGLEDVTQLVVNTGSASGATVDMLKGDKRTLVLATRSGRERHATRFGAFFAEALVDGEADVDKNNIVSAEEAFNFAERRVKDFYERNGQLATEHPRLEGAQANRFSIARLGQARRATAGDAQLTRMQAERDALNARIDALRLRRDAMTAEAYQQELLNNMLELATLEDAIEQREAEIGND